MPDTPDAIIRRINAHLANIDYPPAHWATAAQHLADEYRAELEAITATGLPPNDDVAMSTAITAAITRFEESITDAS